MNFFDHKDLGNHLLQLCPEVVKHPVYIHIYILIHTYIHTNIHIYIATITETYIHTYIHPHNTYLHT